MQPGDVPETWADVDDLVRDLDYSPHVQIREGVERFVKWYMEYFRIK
jgi:UDP-glucuronate 4-epimerase